MTPDSTFEKRVAVICELTEILEVNRDHAFGVCPGDHLHTKQSGHRHFQISGLRSGDPHAHCFHQGCRDEVRKFNEAMRERLALAGANVWPWSSDEEAPERYSRRRVKARDDDALRKIAAEILPEVEDMQAWLEERSPGSCDGIDGFLRQLFPGAEDRVILFKDENSQGQFVWSHASGPEWQAGFRYGNADGCFFLLQPVTGNWLNIPRLERKGNPRGRSRRAQENITRFEYLLLESDCTDLESWCRVLVHLPMPIVSVTTSGARSIHALVRVGAADRAEWEEYRSRIEPVVTKYGSDPGALRCVQLSRLPGCLRYGKMNGGSWVPFPDGPREQKLLWFDPGASGDKTILEKMA